MSETPAPEETPVPDETTAPEPTPVDPEPTPDPEPEPEPEYEDEEPAGPAKLYDYLPGGSWERDDLIRLIEGEPFRVELDESINVVEIRRDGKVAAANGKNWGAVVGPDHWLVDEETGLRVRTRQAVLSAAVDHECEIQDLRRHDYQE